MKQILFTIFFGASCLILTAQTKTTKTLAKPSAKPTTTVINLFKNGVDSASYALGMRIAQNLKSQGLDPLNLAVFQKGMQDAFQLKKPIIAEEALDISIGNYQKVNSSKKSAVAIKAGQNFLLINGKKPGVITLPSGMQYQILKAGTDTVKPTLASTVKCHYHGTVINGQIFDSSVDRGEPISFPLGNVIRGWQEGLQLMTVGSKYKFFIPSDLAYGDQQKGDKIAPGSLLIFEVELLGIEN